MTVPGGPAPRRVLIVGAGIAGLATALRLRRSGWEVLIVERAPALRGSGYAINFGGIGYDAAERLGVVAALRAAQPPPVELVYVDQAGRRQAGMGLRTQQELLGDRVLSLFRGDLEQTLHDAVAGEAEFRFGRTVDAITEDAAGVTATLSDGSRERVDMLVGADGLHSRVRSLVFGPETRFRYDLGCVIAIGMLDRLPDRVEPGTSTALGLARRGVSVYAPTADRAAAFFIFRTDRAEDDLRAGHRETLRARYGDLGWIVPELLDSMDRSETVYFDQVSQVRMDRWSSGRVVLAGDAAWCVSLFAGYGSSLAVGGAGLLGDLLDEEADIPTALHRWEQQLRPTAERRRRQGRYARGLFVSSTAFGARARTSVMRLSGSPVVMAVMRRFLGLTRQTSGAR